MSSTNGEKRKKDLDRDRLADRVWLGLLGVVPALMTEELNPPPAYPMQPCLGDLLDKTGDVVGRAFCRLETKLGLRPKNWPPVQTDPT
jgi:hypothetical protein